MKTSNELRDLLRRIDHRGYPAYKDTRGSWGFRTRSGAAYTLNIEHVQGDPFAAPSSLSIEVDGRLNGFPREYMDRNFKRITLEDFVIRSFSAALARFSGRARGSGGSGRFGMSRPGQEVLWRSAAAAEPDSGRLTVRFEAGFPASGRSINARELEKMLFEYLPQCVERALLYPNIDQDRLREAVELAEDREFLKNKLEEEDLVAFVADGSVLPRESGVSSRPMKGAVPFRSPESMRIAFDLPHHGRITGMAVRSGITLIIGGGYHGKSTLLKALETGIYPHIKGDGREYVVTSPAAVKIRAEDGRCVTGVDISLFIRGLPNGKDTRRFSTEDASGSTSQAANVIEAIEAGASTLLIDEDTSATNFMVRDRLMQEVIHPDKEPITPFLDRMEDLYRKLGVSTILVAGSSGAFFEKADAIIQMDRYLPKDVTGIAKAAASRRAEETPEDLPSAPPFRMPSFSRAPLADHSLRYKGRVRIRTNGTDSVTVGRETVDLRYVEQLADSEQLTMLGKLLTVLLEDSFDGQKTLRSAVRELSERLEAEGFSAASPHVPGNLAMPRPQEIFACVNRLRRLKLR